MHAESRYRAYPIDEDKLHTLVCTLSAHGDGCCIVGESSDGQIVGVVLGFVAEFFFSRARHAGELVVYVTPEHRGSWVALKMAQTWIDWAKTTDAVEIEAGVSAEINNAAADRFYERLGFSPVGRSFVRGL